MQPTILSAACDGDDIDNISVTTRIRKEVQASLGDYGKWSGWRQRGDWALA